MVLRDSEFHCFPLHRAKETHSSAVFIIRVSIPLAVPVISSVAFTVSQCSLSMWETTTDHHKPPQPFHGSAVRAGLHEATGLNSMWLPSGGTHETVFSRKLIGAPPSPRGLVLPYWLKQNFSAAWLPVSTRAEQKPWGFTRRGLQLAGLLLLLSVGKSTSQARPGLRGGERDFPSGCMETHMYQEGHVVASHLWRHWFALHREFYHQH